MSELSTSEARENFADIINTVAFAKKRQIVNRHGKALVAIIPIEDLEYLERLEAQTDLDDAKEAFEDIKKSGTTSWDDLKKKS